MPNGSPLLQASILGLALLAAAPAGDLRISGPYTHDNLSIFLIHDSARGQGKPFLTLQEAMEQKKVVVYETGNVNQLAIENVSSDQVYIQSGDIVKGGQQDRVFSDDMVLKSHSGKVPIASFCVEHGRWSRRGSEASDRFSSTDRAVAGKSLKMAVRDKKDQREVWDQVAQSQARMAVAAPQFTPPASNSMQLAMENKNVADATGAYVRSLSKIIDTRPDVVGYAFAINGKVNSADIYASAELFRKMWPKLLNASAVEAFTDRPKASPSDRVDAAAVRSALASAESGRETMQPAAGQTSVMKKESDKVLLYETREGSRNWIHKSYVVK
jgi:hypothetical protein